VTVRVWINASRSYVQPLPERVGIGPRGCSRRLQRVLSNFGSEQPFGRAAQSVQEPRVVHSLM